MNTTIPTSDAGGLHSLADEGRVLFTLLDAADCTGLMTGLPVEATWRALRRDIAATDRYEAAAERLFEFMHELDAHQVLDGTWIGRHWEELRHRVET